MRNVLASLMAILLWVLGCTQLPPPEEPAPRDARRRDFTPVKRDMDLWDSCTRERAEKLAEGAQTDDGAALKAANCYLALVRQGEDGSLKLADARRGRKLAEDVVIRSPHLGLAHYLAAYFTGMEAQLDPSRGLELVPIIEREALTAAQLNPRTDHGGPDRMLGELYLRAPGFPMSVGDSSKALIHYRRALAHDPDFLENRLGLVEALLSEEEVTEACNHLAELLAEMQPPLDHRTPWRKALRLLRRLCSMVNSE